MGSVIGVNHVGISVRDLEAARGFWGALGFREVMAFGWPRGTTPADEALGITDSVAEVVVLAGSTSYLELFAFSAPVPERRAPDAPGIAGLTLEAPDVGSTVDGLRALGHEAVLATGGRTATLRCPEGTPLRIEQGDATGLRRVLLRVPDPASHPLLGVAPEAPVALDAVAGGDGAVPGPCDLGPNHVCLDVDGIAGVRAGLGDGVRWNHAITASSGGIASVCYGTTLDGVLVELLENHSADAALSRERLALQ